MRGNVQKRRGRLRGASCRAAFSLTEVLVVVGVISLLLALAAPSFVALGPSRKAGIHELAGFLESARASAVATRSPRVVAFADLGYPGEEAALRTYALFEVEAPEEGASAPDPPVLRRLSPWRTLPKGLVFGFGSDFESAEGGGFRTLHDLSPSQPVPVPAPGTGGPDVTTRPLPFVEFGPDGGVRRPGFVEADALHLGVVEGFFDPGTRRVVPTGGRQGPGGRVLPIGDCLEIGYYTGRTRILTD
jgi:prepilin-type N-terminal cleavage/methylation domain-containing protein